MSAASESPSDSTSARSGSAGPFARAALVLAVVVTAAAFTSLMVILAVYFAQGTPHPGLYWTALWGFPLGFALMCVYVVTGPVRRRRLSAT